MARVFVFGSALLFVFVLAALTVVGIEHSGFTAVAVVSILLLIVLAVGIVGAMRHPPR